MKSALLKILMKNESFNLQSFFSQNPFKTLKQPNKMLTKSNYLLGLQCHKLLHIAKNNKDRLPEVDISKQFIFDQGTEVGELATKLYENGIDLSKEDFRSNLIKSKEAITKKQPIFEAGLIHNNCYSRADILVPVEDEWDIIEVKSGTKVKDVNIHDVSFQKYVYEGVGLKIRKCFILHLNNEYVRQGDLDINQLFKKTEITSEVEELMKDIEERIEPMFNTINTEEPTVSIGKQCDDPYTCPVKKECWEFLPKHNVFHLSRGKNKAIELFEKGILELKDIPEDFKLTGKQEIQRECHINDKPHIHKEKIKSFLNQLDYPLYYLDFETFSTAIPKFDGLKPYSQVPFQYSLHVVKEEGAEAEHFEFLYDGSDDPRREFAEALKDVLGDTGSIVVYNQSFEISRIKELGVMYPEFKDWSEDVISRVIDLLVPFREFAYYDSDQNGSASIKYVLPVLTGEGYSEMGIGSGTAASTEFYNATYGECTEEKKEEVRKHLLEYCKLDTLAEVMIVDKLREL